MDTNDIPTAHLEDWRREPSERANALLGKLCEEAGELASRCARAMIQGLEEIDPGSRRTNREELEDEIADVAALSALAMELLHLDGESIASRARKKVQLKRPWIENLPD